MVLLHPMHQGVDDHLLHHGVVGVDGVSTAAPVDQLRGCAQVGHVVCLVVDAPHADGVPIPVICLCRVVVHNVQQHLNAVFVQRLDHLFELVCRSDRPTTVGRKAAHRGEEVDVRVAPNVDHVAAWVLVALELKLVVLKHRQQLHSGDAQLLEVSSLFCNAEVGSAQTFGHARAGTRSEWTDRHLVNNQVFQVLLLACAIVAPVEWRRIKVKCSKELAADLVLEVLNLVAHAKAAAARCKRGIRVEQHALGVPALAGFPAALA
mmetsp:Transcript_21079/g.63114  ORF Transcript_21079/g.63114 Transcript_21079/m.63114 type:complete len:263 (+) Transcript_21079:1271-2059(+)